MKKLGQSLSILIALFICGCTPSETSTPTKPSMMLWYDKPAANWNEALPIGNGRLGAMVYGGIENDTIQFNEETLWTGQPHNYAHPKAHEVLDDLRQLVWNGKQEEAHVLGNERFMSQPLRQFSYQAFGAINLQFPGHGKALNFKRDLNIEDAISSVQYEVEGTTFKREIFATEEDQAIVMNIEASEPGRLNFNISLASPHSKNEVTVEGDRIILRGKADNFFKEIDVNNIVFPESQIIFEAQLKVQNEGGEVLIENNRLKVVNAHKAMLQLVAATSFKNYKDISGNPAALCKTYLENLEGKTYPELKKRHILDYQSLFNRMTLELGKSDLSDRPTDQRLITFKDDEDPNMVALLYNYGRYLLISSSRKGTQPANLQGIWNDRLSPPWGSKYTININTEMNYWLAEMTNLSELTDPLTKMVEDLSETGKEIAKQHYNLDGWVTHHNTDIWRGAAPINNANHGIWVSGGAWLSQHLWWHYQYTYDKNYLKNRAYPVLKGASRFFMDYLVQDPNNPQWLVSGPSNSPENGGLAMAPTMDHQIIRNLFSNTIEAASILNIDEGFTKSLAEIRGKIAPNLIGKHGQLQEWLIDQDDPSNEHRHVSHLWGLHPGNEIHPLTTPELADACKVTLAHRGDGGTGWSRGWKINFWARLLDGDHSFLLLKNLMVPSISEDTDYLEGGGLYNNLLDAHPPFQIDGNFGATSGITEMLLQSHLRDEGGNYFQDILPALPTVLSVGKISGIKGRGAFEISMEWENGALTNLAVKSLMGNPLTIRYKGKMISRETKMGETLTFTSADFK